MEVIHRLSGAYPFFLQYEPQHTFLEVVKENLTQEQIAIERLKLKILRQMHHPNLIKLERIYREDTTLHLLYEYYPISLEKYVEERSQSAKLNQRHQALQLHQQFTSTINIVIQSFVQAQIKADICILGMAVSNREEGQIKIFVDPYAEFHTLNRSDSHISQKQEEEIEYKTFLRDYYHAQNKRLIIEFEEWLEKYFGKNYYEGQNNHPNFVINGSKLVFLNQPSQKHQNQHKKHLINDTHNQRFKGEVEGRLGKSPNKGEEFKKQLKQKNQRKIEQIKNVLNRLEHKTLNFNNLVEPRSTPHHKEHHEMPHYRNSHKHSSHEKIHQQETSQHVPHLLRKQKTDGIIFKPQEITVEKTPRLEENEYLESLEHELQKISQLKQAQSDKILKAKRLSSLKDAQDAISRQSPSTSNSHEDKSSIEHTRQLDIKTVPMRNKTETANIHTQLPKQEEKKEDKHNKYKMKITTSHQFQIEGAGQPQIKQIQRDIVEGIKSGRINLSEFQNMPNHYQIQTTEILDNQMPTFHQETEPNSTASDIPHRSKNVYQGTFNPNDHRQEPRLSNSAHQAQFYTKGHHQGDNSESISDKIREAKSKAQQVLKDYVKKKH